MSKPNDTVAPGANTTEPVAIASSSSPENTVPKGERKFTLEKLRAKCRELFGVTTSTFDGATSGLDGKYTIAQIKKSIDDWGNKPVASPNRKEGN